MDAHSLLKKQEFPRSQKYDADWMLDNQMGPNAVWLTEWLSEAASFKPGMRVLDLGCGRAMSSIFLAKEFGVQVWAADLWIGPDSNWKRVVEAGVEHLVFPLRAEAHALPFPKGFFDAIVSVDAYQYFGTDTLYLGYICGFVKPGGTVAIVMPGLMQPFPDGIPEHLATPQANGKKFWEPECACFKTADWWHDLWRTDPCVADVRVATLAEGWRHWRDFEKTLETSGKNIFPSDAEALERDAGRYIGFIRVAATRTNSDAMNIYDATIGAQVGVDT